MMNRNSDMFHDKGAHDLELRFAFLAGFAVAIGVLYWVIYHAAF